MKDITDGVVTPEEELVVDTRIHPNGSERDDDWIVYTYGPDMFYNLTWRELLLDGCGCGCFWPLAIVGGAIVFIALCCLLHYWMGSI